MKLKWFRLPIIILIFWIHPSVVVWAQTEKVTAFVNVNLVPMTSETIIPDQTVLVKETRIIEIGPSSRIDIPHNSNIIHGSNAYLMPGLADMHMHTDPNWLGGDWPVSPFNLYLANGVTTIRCFGPKGRSPDNVLFWREAIERGDLFGPWIYACGEQLRGHLRNPEEMVRKQKAAGFDFIKLYSYLSKEEFHRAMTTAREVGMYTAGHIPFQVGLDGILAEDMDEIAHVEELFWEFVDFDRNLYFDSEDEWMSFIIRTTFKQFEPYLNTHARELEEKLSRSMLSVAKKVRSGNKPVCTTLYLDELIVEKLFEPEKFLSKPENTYLPQKYIDAFRQGREKHQVQFRGGEVFTPFKRKADRMLLHHLKQVGVPLVLATDAGTGWMGLVPGYSVHDELQLLIQNGFTPYEAIKTATVNAANVVESMIGKGNFGTIEVGKRADLILIEGNPFDDIENLSSLQRVMASGRWYDKVALQKMITPDIPVTGAIHHVHEPDKSHYTYVDIIIGKTFSGSLPGDIDTITITGPRGILPIRKSDFTFIPQLRDFFIRIPGSPEIGFYTFEIISGNKNGTTADYQYVLKTLPTPDTAAFSSNNGATLSSNSLTFSWHAVKTDMPVYYRFEINKLHGGRVYSTGYNKDMVSHTAPIDVLKSGQTYRWRVRIADSDDWVNVQNRSNSEWQIFHLK
jgi:imidazolonepropionase-like amidohydrolase